MRPACSYTKSLPSALPTKSDSCSIVDKKANSRYPLVVQSWSTPRLVRPYAGSLLPRLAVSRWSRVTEKANTRLPIKGVVLAYPAAGLPRYRGLPSALPAKLTTLNCGEFSMKVRTCQTRHRDGQDGGIAPCII